MSSWIPASVVPVMRHLTQPFVFVACSPVRKTVMAAEVSAAGEHGNIVTQSATVKRSCSVRRTPSFRPEDISTPRLQSSTNSALTPLMAHGRTFLDISSVNTSSVIPHSSTIVANDNSRTLEEAATTYDADKSVLHQQTEQASSTTHGDQDIIRPTRKAPPPPNATPATSPYLMRTAVASTTTTTTKATPSPTDSSPVPSLTSAISPCNAAPKNNSENSVIYQNSSEFMARCHENQNRDETAENALRANNCADVNVASQKARPKRPPPPKKTSDNLPLSPRPHDAPSLEMPQSSSASLLSSLSSDSSAASLAIPPNVTSLKNKFENNSPKIHRHRSDAVVPSGASLVTRSQSTPRTGHSDPLKKSVSVTRTPSTRPSVPPKPTASPTQTTKRPLVQLTKACDV
jgi:hypothetical protein